MITCFIAPDLEVRAQVNQMFVWVDGSTEANQPGVYGTKGVASPSNVPGARYDSVTWTDINGKLWLFGGRGNDKYGILGWLNDLWVWNPKTEMWTWMSGSDEINQRGVYGSKGLPNQNNEPGARYRSGSWVDLDGNLWMFGGTGYDKNGFQGWLNDLWVWNPKTEMWTWMSGSDERNQTTIFGIKGTALSSNAPGGREDIISWRDSNGRLWLFGGRGPGEAQTYSLNELWVWDIEDKLWTWISGSELEQQPGVYGTRGIASERNVPGARSSSVSLMGLDGTLLLFGGFGFDSNGSEGDLNDLWAWDPGTEMWTWLSGSSTVYQHGDYGELGEPAESNVPGARTGAVAWNDPEGRGWIFGGNGRDSNGLIGRLNDLWMWNPNRSEWTWVNGSDERNQTGVYGTKGVASDDNIPGARISCNSWQGKDGNLWLFGGLDISGSLRYFNDLWRIETSPASLVTGADRSAVRIPQPSGKEFDFSGGYTVEMWFNQSSSGETQTLFSTVSSGGDSGFEIEVSENSGINVHYHGGTLLESSDFIVRTGVWTHLAYVVNSDGRDIFQALYINGDRASIETDAPEIVRTNTEEVLFANNRALSSAFQGLMNDLKIWERALTQQEIRDRMFLSPAGKEPGLAGAWHTRKTGAHGAVDLTRTRANAQKTGNIGYEESFPEVGTFIYGSKGWRMLGRPYGDVTYQEWLSGLWTQGFPGASNTSGTPNVYHWDEASREWITPNSITNIVGTSSDADGSGAGGTVMFVFDEDESGNPQPFPKLLTTGEFDLVNSRFFDLSFSDTGISGDDGWNLVYNPYPLAIYWQDIVDFGDNRDMINSVYIWDHSANFGQGGYLVHYGEPVPPSLPGSAHFNGVIPAFQSFWVKAVSSNAQLRIRPEHHVQNRRLYKETDGGEDPRKVFALTLSGQGFTDHASVIFNEAGLNDVNVPAMRSLNQRTAEITLRHENSRYNVVTVNPSPASETLAFEIDLHATAEGEYVLSWPTIGEFGHGWIFVITDRETGERFDLIEGDVYNFAVASQEFGKISQDQSKPVRPLKPTVSKEAPARFVAEITMGDGLNSGVDADLPKQVMLSQNFPNPFNPTTVISYQLPQDSHVQLSVYDMLGRRVALLVDGQIQAGTHRVTFDGSQLSSGVYLYRLSVDGRVYSKKLTLMK